MTRVRRSRENRPCPLIGLAYLYPYPSNIRLTRLARSIKLTFDDTRDRSTDPPFYARWPISSECYRRFDSIRRYLAVRQGAIVVSGNCYCAFEAVALGAIAAAAPLRDPPIFLFFCSLRLNRLNLTTKSFWSFPSPRSVN